MKSNNIRQYAEEAFRFYAKWGNLYSYKQKVWMEALENRGDAGRGGSMGSPTESAIVRAEKAVERVRPALADLEAAENTLRKLYTQQPEIAMAVRLVYMWEPEKSLSKGTMRERIVRASLEIPASERSVYYWLSIATKVFALERGLRID